MNDDFVANLQQIKQKNQEDTEKENKHQALRNDVAQVSKNILEGAKMVVDSVKERPHNVSVDNFPAQLATTADIQALREVLERNTTKTLEKTDNGTEGLRKALQANLDKLEEIAKKDNQGDVTAALASLEEELKDKSVEVTNLDDLGNFFFELQQAIENKDLKVNVEAPVVNVPEVDLTPLNELAEKIDTLTEEVKALQKDDTNDQEIIALLKKNNDISNKILTRPIPVPTVGKSGGQYGIVDVEYDYFSVNVDTTVDTYTYKRNGASGTTVATVIITYTDSTKQTVSSVAKTTP
jgi:CHASE3 domain sensor protein